MADEHKDLLSPPDDIDTEPTTEGALLDEKHKSIYHSIHPQATPAPVATTPVPATAETVTNSSYIPNAAVAKTVTEPITDVAKDVIKKFTEAAKEHTFSGETTPKAGGSSLNINVTHGTDIFGLHGDEGEDANKLYSSDTTTHSVDLSRNGAFFGIDNTEQTLFDDNTAKSTVESKQEQLTWHGFERDAQTEIFDTLLGGESTEITEATKADTVTEADSNNATESQILDEIDLNLEKLIANTPLQQILEDDALVETVKALATEEKVSLLDLMAIGSPLAQSDANVSNDIIKSIIQADTLEGPTTVKHFGIDAKAKVGDTTNFNVTDNASVTTTPISTTFENKLSGSAEYDNGYWHDKLSGEANIRAGSLGGVHGNGKLTHEKGTEFLSIADSISGEAHISGLGISAKAGVESSIKIGKNTTVSGSDTTSFDLNVDEIALSNKKEASIDNGIIYDKVTVSDDIKASIDKGLVREAKVSNELGIKNVASITEEASGKMTFKDGKATLEGTGTIKGQLGNDNINVQQKASATAGIVSDGSAKVGVEKGGSAKLGPVEAGGSASVSKTTSESKDSTDVGVKANAGVQVTKGSKFTTETSMKASAATEKSDGQTINSDSFELGFKSRIEIDYENASDVEIAAAAVYNTAAKITEFATKEAFKIKNEEIKENGEAPKNAQAQNTDPKVEESKWHINEANEHISQADEHTAKAQEYMDQAEANPEEAQSYLESAQTEMDQANAHLHQADKHTQAADDCLKNANTQSPETQIDLNATKAELNGAHAEAAVTENCVDEAYSKATEATEAVTETAYVGIGY